MKIEKPKDSWEELPRPKSVKSRKKSKKIIDGLYIDKYTESSLVSSCVAAFYALRDNDLFEAIERIDFVIKEVTRIREHLTKKEEAFNLAVEELKQKALVGFDQTKSIINYPSDQPFNPSQTVIVQSNGERI